LKFALFDFYKVVQTRGLNKEILIHFHRAEGSLNYAQAALFEFAFAKIRERPRAKIRASPLLALIKLLSAYFFLLATVLLGPFLVLAFVFVFCPRTGSPFLWRIPL
jgi:hypothetical protein